MKSNTSNMDIKLIVYGGLLAIIKLVYLFFDFYNILDFVVYVIAGFALGGKIPKNRWFIGLLLALPTFAICLVFVLNLGYSQIIKGVGTSFAISLILIPLSTAIGILAKHTQQRKSKS